MAALGLHFSPHLALEEIWVWDPCFTVFVLTLQTHFAALWCLRFSANESSIEQVGPPLVYANNSKTLDALKNNIRIEIRRTPHEMLDRATASFNMRVGKVIRRQGAWIVHIINYCAVLAKWWCMRNSVTPHEPCLSVRQVYEKIAKYSFQ